MKNAEMIQLYVDVSCDEARSFTARGKFKDAETALMNADQKLNGFDAQRGQSYQDFKVFCLCSSRLKIAWELLDQSIEAQSEKERAA